MSKHNHADFNKRATIDDEERRLIDAAVAAGKVQKIPQGKSALDVEYVWEGDEKHHGVGKLVMTTPLSPEEVRARWNGRYSAMRKPVPAIVARRAEVLRLTNEGFKAAAIAEFLQCSEAKVNNDRKFWQGKGKLPLLSGGAPGLSVNAIKARRKKVLKLYLAKVPYRKIAEKLGSTKGAIVNDVLVLKAQGKIPQPEKIAAE